MSALRRSAHLALALVLSLFAIAPHQHEGLAEHGFRDTVASINDCAPSAAHHFDAARVVHAHPCLACVRNHAAGAFRSTIPTFTQPSSVVRAAIVLTLPPTHFRDFTPLRGPPAA
ncbi:MAG TPA: hypothetical protein VHW00_21160 [Thermoanaerobaculia bacterium]|nr:hypothetical protein [Thermoanaerobaculia bacterium]